MSRRSGSTPTPSSSRARTTGSAREPATRPGRRGVHAGLLPRSDRDAALAADDIKKSLNLESRGRGRIWRIATEGFKPTKFPDFSKLTAAQLADELLSANQMRRLMAQRLVVQGAMKDAVEPIRSRFEKSEGKPGRANQLWTLHGLGEVPALELWSSLKDANAGIREQSLRVAEDGLAGRSGDEPLPSVTTRSEFASANATGILGGRGIRRTSASRF